MVKLLNMNIVVLKMLHILHVLLWYILGTAHPVAVLCERVDELLSVDGPQLKQSN